MERGRLTCLTPPTLPLILLYIVFSCYFSSNGVILLFQAFYMSKRDHVERPIGRYICFQQVECISLIPSYQDYKKAFSPYINHIARNNELTGSIL